jgi:hypothetical protein
MCLRFLAVGFFLLGIFGGCRHKDIQTPEDSTPLIPAEQLSKTDIVPHLDAPIESGKSCVYCATFQIAWDELREQLSGKAVELEGNPALAAILNQHSFARSDLSASSYLAMAGRTDQSIVSKMRAAMHEKFPNASFSVPDPPPKTVLYVYAYLAKVLAFQEAYDRLEKPLEFKLPDRDVKVAAFGTECFSGDSPRKIALCKQVTVLDYQNDDDFIIELKTSSKNDRIILAKVDPKTTLRETIQAMEKRIENSTLKEWMKEPAELESLKIPVIALGVEKKYQELIGKWLRNRGWENMYIGEARQGIRFQLDERGARLESDSSLAVCSEGSEHTRHFVFDRPFLICLKESSAAAPYFAAWIGSADLLEPIKE